MFVQKQARACLFGITILALLVATHLLWPAGAPLSRYDFLVLAALAIQALMLAFKLETWDEAAVILVFHVTGTIMELFKTANGSWIYPEDSYLRIGAVPLFSGFMYASIGSYIARAQRLFDVRFEFYPPVWATWALAVAAYVNFFSHHYIPDFRGVLFIGAAALFWKTMLVWRADAKERRMPLLAALIGVAFLIWVAENVGTVTRTWLYPSQRTGWHMVPIGKMGAWFLLMMLSFVLTGLVKRPRVQGPATG